MSFAENRPGRWLKDAREVGVTDREQNRSPCCKKVTTDFLMS